VVSSPCLCSLQTARDHVWSFLCVLHDTYEWSYSRLFVFAFSQGACVAFHVAMTLPRDVRLGGVVLVAGGAMAGPHLSAPGMEDGAAAATPMLQVTGVADQVYPATLAELSRREFKRRHAQKAAADLFTSLNRPTKGHAMIDSRDDMQHVMRFFSEHLYLRNMELENRSDVIELQT
jgi:pimeloyl-ACP methyl ester carboxylesterase